MPLFGTYQRPMIEIFNSKNAIVDLFFFIAAQASLRLGRQGNQLEHPPTTNSKLYDRVRNEPLSENKSWRVYKRRPQNSFLA